MNNQSTSPLFIFINVYLNHLMSPPEKILLLQNKIVKTQNILSTNLLNASLCHMTLNTHRPVLDTLKFLINSTDSFIQTSIYDDFYKSVHISELYNNMSRSVKLKMYVSFQIQTRIFLNILLHKCNSDR